MRIGLCCTEALGWRTIRSRWVQCLTPEAFHPENFGAMGLQRGLRTLGKSLAMRRAVSAALRAGCDRVLVATNGEATLINPRHAAAVAIYGDAAHAQLSQLYGFERSDRKNEARAARIRRLVSRGARLIAMSTWSAAGFEAEYGTMPAVVPGPVDAVLFSPENPSNSSAHALFIGGDFRRKGGHDLLRAMAAVEGVRLTILPRPDRKIPDYVTAVQPVSPDSRELVHLYQSADFFVLPTHADCSPNAIVEAQSCGLPVIATSVGGIGDLVQDGVNGLLVSPGDIEGLAGAIAALASSPELRSRFGAAGRERVLTAHDFPVHRAAILAALA